MRGKRTNAWYVVARLLALSLLETILAKEAKVSEGFAVENT
jgi:hypothetical protein